MIRAGLIGCGAWGKNLARNLDACGALAALCDADAEALERQNGLYPTATTWDDPAALFASGAIDAVVIAAPAPLHNQLINAAFDAGIDVYCEKPLTVDLAQAEALAARAAAEGRILMVGHLLRYHPAFEHLAAAVAAGRLGSLRLISANRISLGAFRAAESALWDLTPHDVSMILALTGDQLPEAVSATGASFLRPGIADQVTSQLRFADGLRVQCCANWLNPVKEQRLTVVGSAGAAVFDDTRPWGEKLSFFGDLVRRDAAGQPWPDPQAGEAVPLAQGEPLLAEVRHFVDCCRNRTTPRTDGAEAVRVMQVCAAAERSLATDGSWQAL